jgi:predicted nucleic acid-binding protein
VKVVSNVSPLITLARLGHLDLLRKLYENVYISTEVYNEVVISGAGMPGAAAVSKAEWIHVTPVTNAEELAETRAKLGLGAGEVSAVFLAKEIHADLTLMDEWKGRRLSSEAGLSVAWKS